MSLLELDRLNSVGVLSCSVGVVGVGGSVSLIPASIRWMEDSRLSTLSAQSVGRMSVIDIELKVWIKNSYNLEFWGID